MEPASETPTPKRNDNSIERLFNPVSALNYQNEYFRLSSSLTYSYVAVLPIILLYEIGIRLVNSGTFNQVRISAEVFIKQFLSLIGLGDTIWFALLILLLGIGIVLYEKRAGLKLVVRYVGLMFAESALYAVLLGSFVALVVGSLFGMVPTILPLQDATTTATSFTTQIILSLGAGVYEEFIFRFLLVTALYLILLSVKIDTRLRYLIAAVVGALIFSGVHYTGSLGDVFTLSSFTFRFLMGLALNALYLTRGFGIAAVTHALYDIYVTILQHT